MEKIHVFNNNFYFHHKRNDNNEDNLKVDKTADYMVDMNNDWSRMGQLSIN